MKIWIETKARLALKKTGGKYILGDTWEVKGEQMVIDTDLHGPMDYVKTLKLNFRVGDLGLTKKRNM